MSIHVPNSRSEVVATLNQMLAGVTLSPQEPLCRDGRGVSFSAGPAPQSAAGTEFFVSAGYPPRDETIGGIAFWVYRRSDSELVLRYVGETRLGKVHISLPVQEEWRIAATVPLHRQHWLTLDGAGLTIIRRTDGRWAVAGALLISQSDDELIVRPAFSRPTTPGRHPLFDRGSSYSELRSKFDPQDKLLGYFYWLAVRRSRGHVEAPTVEHYRQLLLVAESDAALRSVDAVADVQVEHDGRRLVVVWEGAAPSGFPCRMFVISPDVIRRMRALLPSFSDQGDRDLLMQVLQSELLATNVHAARLMAAVPELYAVANEQGDIRFEVEAPEDCPLPTDGTWLVVVQGQPAGLLPDAFALAGEIESKTASSNLFGLTSSLRAALEEAVAEEDATAERLIRVRGTVDPLEVLLAGEEDRPIVTSPLWYTLLEASPSQLSWRADGGPWQVRVFDQDYKPIFSQRTEQPQLPVPDQTRENLAGQREVYWEVYEEGEVLVRGYFSVRPLDRQRADLCASLLDDSEVGSTLHAAAILYDAQHYQRAAAVLEELQLTNPPAACRVLLHRALANIYGAIYRHLAGDRQLGTPEGVWAVALSRQHLDLAYQSLGG